MSRAEDDEIDALMRAGADAAIAADARSLTGHEVRSLREALRQARVALTHVNTKGLPFTRRLEVENARHAIATAQPIVAVRRRAGAADVVAPDRGTAHD